MAQLDVKKISEQAESYKAEMTRFLQLELAGKVEAGDGGVESWAQESID